MAKNNLTPAERRALVASVVKLAYRFAWQVAAPRLGDGCIEDAAHEAIGRAGRAATSWDPAAGVKFSTYAYRAMWWAVMEYVRAEEKARKARPAGSLRGVIGPEDGRAEAEDQGAYVRRLVARLPDRWRAVIEARYGLGDGRPKTQAECMAASGHKTRQCVGSMQHRAMKRLRELAGAV